MKHRKLFILSVTLAAVLYVVLCFFAVFSVNDISVNYSVYTDSDKAACEQILSSYRGKSLLFLNTDKLAQEITDSTNLKVESITKRYPFTLDIKLFSRQERFAIKTAQGDYYILDDEYTVIDKRPTFENASDKLSNVLLEFVTGDVVTAEIKKPLTISNDQLLQSLKLALSCFDSPRDLLEKVTVFKVDNEVDNYRFIFGFRSGVTMEVRKALYKPQEKCMAGLEKYLSLQDINLYKGTIICYTLDSGEVKCYHSY